MDRISPLEKRVLEAIGLKLFHPNQLVCILAYVDSREKMVLTREELCEALERLERLGYIRETNHLRYHRGTSSHGRFTGVSEAEYRQACDEYGQWFKSRPA
jgi:hypothetical protein